MTLREEQAPSAPQRDPSAREVFEILVREHADMLAGFLASLVRSAEARDDLFQETMLTAWNKLGSYDHTQPFGPWLRGIARNLIRRHHERSARDTVRLTPELLEGLEEAFERTVDRNAGWSELRERLARCLSRLPERLRAAIALVYERGLRVRQAAEELGDSEEAVKKRVQRGRRQLAVCLREGEQA